MAGSFNSTNLLTQLRGASCNSGEAAHLLHTALAREAHDAWAVLAIAERQAHDKEQRFLFLFDEVTPTEPMMKLLGSFGPDSSLRFVLAGSSPSLLIGKPSLVQLDGIPRLVLGALSRPDLTELLLHTSQDFLDSMAEAPEVIATSIYAYSDGHPQISHELMGELSKGVTSANTDQNGSNHTSSFQTSRDLDRSLSSLEERFPLRGLCERLLGSLADRVSNENVPFLRPGRVLLSNQKRRKLFCASSRLILFALTNRSHTARDTNLTSLPATGEKFSVQEVERALDFLGVLAKVKKTITGETLRHWRNLIEIDRIVLALTLTPALELCDLYDGTAIARYTLRPKAVPETTQSGLQCHSILARFLASIEPLVRPQAHTSIKADFEITDEKQTPDKKDERGGR